MKKAHQAYVTGAFGNDKLFQIQSSSQEVGKNCRYISICNSEAISPITLKHGHFVHQGVFLLLTFEPSKISLTIEYSESEYISTAAMPTWKHLQGM